MYEPWKRCTWFNKCVIIWRTGSQTRFTVVFNTFYKFIYVWYTCWKMLYSIYYSNAIITMHIFNVTTVTQPIITLTFFGSPLLISLLSLQCSLQCIPLSHASSFLACSLAFRHAVILFLQLCSFHIIPFCLCSIAVVSCVCLFNS